MKLFAKVVLICCACMRMIDSADNVRINSTTVEKCNTHALIADCLSSGEYIKELVNAALYCNRVSLAKFLARYCSRNKNGMYCIIHSATNDELNSIETSCSSVIQSGSGNCPAMCKSQLQTFLESRGCCVNEVGRNSSIARMTSALPVFQYSLWSRCGVDPPPLTCPGVLSYVEPATNKTCNSSEFSTRVTRVTCTQLFKLASELRRNGSCNVLLQSNYFTDACSVDENNRLCFDLHSAALQNSISVQNLVTACQDNHTCTSACKTLLNQFISHYDCCINSLFNSTYGSFTLPESIQSTFVNTDIFTRCGISPPGTCASLFSGSPTLEAVTIMVLIFLVLTIHL